MQSFYFYCSSRRIAMIWNDMVFWNFAKPPWNNLPKMFIPSLRGVHHHPQGTKAGGFTTTPKETPPRRGVHHHPQGNLLWKNLSKKFAPNTSYSSHQRTYATLNGFWPRVGQNNSPNIIPIAKPFLILFPIWRCFEKFVPKIGRITHLLAGRLFF